MPSLEQSTPRRSSRYRACRAARSTSPSGADGTFKAALVHYTQGLAYHLAGKGIRANTVSPGNVYFEGGVWEQIEPTTPKLLRGRARAESDRADGHAPGDRQRGRVHRESAGELRERHEPRRRRCADQGRPALTVGDCGVGSYGFVNLGIGATRPARRSSCGDQSPRRHQRTPGPALTYDESLLAHECWKDASR